jgi:Arc/MetJ-type ribon-helix-helix transcriptional regulator
VARDKIAITMEEPTLRRLDRLVEKQVFANRSQAIEVAVAEKVERLEQGRLARECARLDPEFERSPSSSKASPKSSHPENGIQKRNLCTIPFPSFPRKRESSEIKGIDYSPLRGSLFEPFTTCMWSPAFGLRLPLPRE